MGGDAAFSKGGTSLWLRRDQLYISPAPEFCDHDHAHTNLPLLGAGTGRGTPVPSSPGGEGKTRRVMDIESYPPMLAATVLSRSRAEAFGQVLTSSRPSQDRRRFSVLSSSAHRRQGRDPEKLHFRGRRLRPRSAAGNKPDIFWHSAPMLSRCSRGQAAAEIRSRTCFPAKIGATPSRSRRFILGRRSPATGSCGTRANEENKLRIPQSGPTS